MRVIKEVLAFLAFWLLCVAIGFMVPQLFDRDVNGAFASGLFGFIGAVVGPIIAFAGIMALRKEGRHANRT